MSAVPGCSTPAGPGAAPGDRAVRHRDDRTRECVPCATTSYPADQRLGLEAGERHSLGIAEAALWLATDTSYAKSAATMDQLLDVNISHAQIHRIAQREGMLVSDAWEALRQRVLGDGGRSILADLERDVACPHWR